MPDFKDVIDVTGSAQYQQFSTIKGAIGIFSIALLSLACLDRSMYISAKPNSNTLLNMNYGIRGAQSPHFKIPVQFPKIKKFWILDDVDRISEITELLTTYFIVSCPDPTPHAVCLQYNIPCDPVT